MDPAQCPACGLALQMPDDAAGRRFACVRCGAQLSALAGGQVALLAQPPPAVNPFAEGAAGGYYAPGFQPAFAPQAMGREQALAKVRGPGITLILYGLMWGIAGMLLPLALLAKEVADDEAQQVIIALGAGLAFLAGAFTVYCGARLMALRSYTLIMVCIGINLVLGFMICPLLAVAAIWPLVVLVDGRIKLHFSAAAPG